jgi:hypothetical protein
MAFDMQARRLCFLSLLLFAVLAAADGKPIRILLVGDSTVNDEGSR